MAVSNMRDPDWNEPATVGEAQLYDQEAVVTPASPEPPAPHTDPVRLHLDQSLTSAMVWFPLSARSMQGPSLFSASESRNFLVL